MFTFSFLVGWFGVLYPVHIHLPYHVVCISIYANCHVLEQTVISGTTICLHFSQPCLLTFVLVPISLLTFQCRCSRCGVLCCKKRKTLAKITQFQTLNAQATANLIEAPLPQPVTELLQIRSTTNR